MSALLHEVFLFHHTSALSRSHPSALRKMRLLPPLVYSAFVDTALALGVECLWAEGEADDVVAFTASARGGFVVGLDSDFVIYGSRAGEHDGHERGYIPINSMRWEAVAASDEADADAAADDGFQVVKAHKGKARDVYRPASPVPPFVPHPDFLVSMTCTVFTPALLAGSLKLPVRLLPLFASLVGNDYVNFAPLLQHRGASAVERVERVARCLREALEPKKGLKAPDGLTELLDRTLRALLVQSVGDDDLDEMTHTLIDSALLYTLPTALPAPLTPSNTFVSAHRETVEPLYLAALTRGEFAPKLSGVVRSGRYVVRPWLEDTTRRSVGRIAGDGLRAAWTAVLDDSLGVGWVDPDVKQVDSAGDLDDESDDGPDGGAVPLAADDDDDDGEEAAVVDGSALLSAQLAAAAPADDDLVADAADGASLEQPHVLVYHRSSAIVHPSLHPVPTLAAILADTPTGSSLSPALPVDEEAAPPTPVVSRPLAWRVELYLALLGSLTPAVRALPDALKPLAAAVRWVLISLAAKADKGTKGRLRLAEVGALVLSGLRSSASWHAWRDTASEAGSAVGESAPGHPFDRSVPIHEITDRGVLVSSHLLHTLHEADLLRQALLVPAETLPRPHVFYSGKHLHALLAEAAPLAFDSADERAQVEQCVGAVLDGGLDGLLCPEPDATGGGGGPEKGRNQRKKEAKKARLEAAAAAAAAGGGGGTKRGFELLGEVDA